MFTVLRLAALGFLLLTVVFVCLWAYFRAVRRDRLEATWDSDLDGDRDTYVQRGLDSYSAALRLRLILTVYVAPAILAAVLTLAIVQ